MIKLIHNSSYFLISLTLLVLLFQGCSDDKIQNNNVPTDDSSSSQSEKLFRTVPAKESGINFLNSIVETDQINFYTYQYLYNGGGVGILDVNNDGLPDLYFSSNMGSDKLYLNKGDFKFEDISEKSNLARYKGWKTGVSIADVNEDGWPDIYVCRSGWYKKENQRANLLFINNGDLTFTESAKKYGLDDPGNSIQAIFFDYDRDQDMDMLLTNHPTKFKQTLGQRLENARNPEDKERDKLYRNNGNGNYTEVSKEVGITTYGHGLGPVVSDLNKDGWPDIYIANDFQTQDYYFENNQDGTFTSKLESVFKHCSYFSMGADIADINNDGELDVYVVEMLAEDNKRQKTNMAPMNPEMYFAFVKAGYHWQMMRNTLQLNNGNGSFSEIGWLSGLTNTDWSWGPLLADYDHDGNKDLVITNGYLKDTQDKDYVKKSNVIAKSSGNRLTFQQVNEMIPSTRIRNYAFKNEGGLRFSDVSEDWGFDFKGFSNGIAYADFDNDGDLDLAVSNINDIASIYENRASDWELGEYLQVQLEGPPSNPFGIGSKIKVYTNEGFQYQEMQVVRGFQSSVDSRLHFGFKNNVKPLKVEIEWWDGKWSTVDLENLNQSISVSYNSSSTEKPLREIHSNSFFEDFTANSGVDFIHEENEYDDYEKELLLPHKQSENGPKLIVGDVDANGSDDFYISGAAGQSGALYLQKKDQFVSTNASVWEADNAYEDLGGTFFDADNDNDLDLYVISGGNEFPEGSNMYLDRLYLNDGRGNFEKSSGILPNISQSGGAVVASDYDGDGDQDLFLGGRLIPAKYPFPPRSYLLNNEGGKFVDVTENIAADLLNPGLITDAIWTDFDQDEKPDLILTGEWTPILMYRNTGDGFYLMSHNYGLGKSNGWWNKIEASDFDNDGDMDYLLGNLGLNYKYKASAEEPFHVYCHDFDNNKTLDIVLGYFNGGVCYPVRGRQCTSEQIPEIARKFPSYTEFGNATIDDVYGDNLKKAFHLEAYHFANSYLENKGQEEFELHTLTVKNQFSPINGIGVIDINSDGIMDALGAGNLFQSEIETGRADAGIGIVLLNNGNGEFNNIEIDESGFFADGDVKDLAVLKDKSGTAKFVIVANNNAPVKVFILKSGGTLIASKK